ncbi:MAG: hypothetical protein ACK5MQ_10865 [Pikeienuella sp.]
MTDPYFGRVAPVCFDMVALAGWGQNNLEANYWDERAADCGMLRDDVMAAKAICGRIGLVRMTLCDFGFDLMAWREYLLAARHPKREKYSLYGYPHPNAAGGVDEVVLYGAANSDRPRQVALAETLMPEMVETALAFCQRGFGDEEEPLWLAAIKGWPFDKVRRE